MQTNHPLILFLARSIARAGLIAWLALIGLFAPTDAPAQAFRITDIQRSNGQILIEHEANPAFYYVLTRQLNLQTGAETPVNIARAFGSTGQVTDYSPPASKGFYRVKSVLLSSPEDTDGDGMDDVYEIDKEYLNPLDPSDASQINSTTGLTELQTYVQDPRSAALYSYLVGTGMADVTGPAAEGGMMGYADGSQKSAGIHDRQWARAFIVAGREANAKRVVFVAVDAGQIFHSVAQGVRDKLQADATLAGAYDEKNMVISATHTHGGAGGQSLRPLYNLNTGGFSWQAYDAQVSGIVSAIKTAHNNLVAGRIRMSKGKLSNASENRAPTRFRLNAELNNLNLSNPFYPDNRDTDMLCLRFEQAGGKELGMFNWFPVHCVSYSQKNRLLTGDNKGLAAYLFERDKGTHYPGHYLAASSSGFVAGFANSNEGDITSNLWTNKSAWPAGVDKMWPGNNSNDLLRVTTIGTRQYEKAMELYNAPTSSLSGAVDYRHMFLSLAGIGVAPQLVYPYNVPGVGFVQSDLLPQALTFAGANGTDQVAGTLDGPGVTYGTIDFAAGLKASFMPINEKLGLGLGHYPKDPMIATFVPANAGGPATVGPTVLPISILRIGQLAILAVPAEFTSIAGWRLRKTVESILGPGTVTVVAGLSNDYSGYVTTYEEYLKVDEKPGGYNGQSYEAASTQFGAFTLAAYQMKFAELAAALNSGGPVNTLPYPRQFESDIGPSLFLFDDVVNPISNDPADDSLPTTREVYARMTLLGPTVNGGCPSGGEARGGFCWSCPAGFTRRGGPGSIETIEVTEHNTCFRAFARETDYNIGDLIYDPSSIWVKPDNERVFRRGETVSATFWGGHPKNVFGRRNARFSVNPVPTFLSVQRDTGGGNWQTIRTDADWDTTFQWERDGEANSKVTVTWCVGGADVTNGTYRIVHTGIRITGGAITGTLTAYQGASPTFTISN